VGSVIYFSEVIMSRLLGVFAILLLLFSAGAGASSDPDVLRAKRIESHSVAIQIESPTYGWITIGSGTIVKEKRRVKVITAKHVAEIFDLYRARVCDARTASFCERVDTYISDNGRDTGSDWAIIPLRKVLKNTRPAKISEEKIMTGAKVYQYGHPRGQKYYNEAVVAAKSIDTEAKLVYWLNGFAYPGSSGGGVFDDKGRLVGITVSISVWPGVRVPFGMLPVLQEDVVHVVAITNLYPLHKG
jgi:hypothetical protein